MPDYRVEALVEPTRGTAAEKWQYHFDLPDHALLRVEAWLRANGKPGVTYRVVAIATRPVAVYEADPVAHPRCQSCWRAHTGGMCVCGTNSGAPPTASAEPEPVPVVVPGYKYGGLL